MSTDTVDVGRERRDGAKICMGLLRVIAEMNNATSVEETMEEHWDLRRRVVSIMTNAFGPTDARSEGFVAALTEYVHFTFSGAGQPDVNVWKPDAVMTDEEIAADRAQRLKEMES